MLVMSPNKALEERWVLRAGYECQEESGDFMLVFESPVQAVNFCIQVTTCC